MKTRKSVVLLLVMTFILCSCTTARPVDVPISRESIQSSINLGDYLGLTLVDGRKFRIHVQAVTNEAIVGEEREFAFSEISEIERLEFDGGKTATLAGASLLFMAILTAVAVSQVKSIFGD
jgi:hypothetical protein